MVCTFNNPAALGSCEMCGSPKPPPEEPKVEEVKEEVKSKVVDINQIYEKKQL